MALTCLLHILWNPPTLLLIPHSWNQWDPIGLDAQWVVINCALSDIKSMDNFIHAMTEQLPFNTSMSHCLVRV